MNPGTRLIVSVMIALPLVHRAAAEDRFPGAEWQHISASQAGWSEAGLATARLRADELHSTAVMVVHHGLVVAEWGDTAKRTELASVRKSFLSALIGIAVARRQIDLDTTLAQLGIDDNPPPLSDVEKQATVRMLLQARSGIYHPALYETPAMAAERPPRGSHRPGTFWYTTTGTSTRSARFMSTPPARESMTRWIN
jgi:CubicO group peptidase (beta-lactamase class C family)